MMSSNLRIATPEYATELFNQLNDDSWLTNYQGDEFPFDYSKTYVSNIKAVNDLQLLIPPSPQTTLYEVDNAIRLYEHMSNLTPMIAADRPLWITLAHTSGFQYAKARWLAGVKQEKLRSTVQDHYFFKRTVRRQAVAGLWWGAHLTRAPWETNATIPKDADPYKYTRLILSNQDVFQGFLERHIGDDPTLLSAALDVIAQKKLSGREARQLVKHLNLVCLYRELGALKYDEIRELAIAL
jgi:hypothetical protein